MHKDWLVLLNCRRVSNCIFRPIPALVLPLQPQCARFPHNPPPLSHLLNSLTGQHCVWSGQSVLCGDGGRDGAESCNRAVEHVRVLDTVSAERRGSNEYSLFFIHDINFFSCQIRIIVNPFKQIWNYHNRVAPGTRNNIFPNLDYP